MHARLWGFRIQSNRILNKCPGMWINKAYSSRAQSKYLIQQVPSKSDDNVFWILNQELVEPKLIDSSKLKLYFTIQLKGQTLMYKFYSLRVDASWYTCCKQYVHSIHTMFSIVWLPREDIFREIAISADLEHKNIVRMIEFYFDKKKVLSTFMSNKISRAWKFSTQCW